jgi:hypothetical protein
MALVKYNNNSISSVTALDSLPSGDLVLLATNTITSGVSSSSFTSNIDSTYDTYMLKYINLHSASNNVQPQINFSIDGGSNYNVTKTTTSFYVNHTEAAGGAGIGYSSGEDLAQSTAYQNLGENFKNDDDSSGCFTMFLFSPSNTTFVKHFIIETVHMATNPAAKRDFIAGYCNTTSAVNAISFKMSSGNIDSAIIKMYGLSKS